jgi:hypothetical protein
MKPFLCVGMCLQVHSKGTGGAYGAGVVLAPLEAGAVWIALASCCSIGKV